MIRHRVCIAITGMLVAGCASTGKNLEPFFQVTPSSSEPLTPTADTYSGDAERPAYVGVRGFLARPPLFDDPAAQKVYDRCAPIEVNKIQEEGNRILVVARQKDHTFAISGINRKPFKKSSSGRLPLLDQHWVRSLDLLHPPRDVSSDARRVCHDAVWRDMKKSEFQFVAGDPEFRQTYKATQGQFDVWTFIGKEKSKPRYYYFLGDRLYTWTH